MHRIAPLLLVTLFVTPSALSANPKSEDTWPGFRGHDMSGIAPGAGVPEKWSTTENIRWKVAVPGQGWSSPIVWGDTVFITSGISGKPFKQPTPGLYGNDYIAEMEAQGLSSEEVMRRVRARDTESPEESDEIRYMVYALDAATGKIKWEREAHKRQAVRRAPSQEHLRVGDAVHRRRARCTCHSARTSASSATRSTATLLWKKHMAAAADLPRLRHRRRRQSSTTGASISLQDSEADSLPHGARRKDRQ